ncbi:MAG: PH domain-containing protein [Dehalococcoidia bacterium]
MYCAKCGKEIDESGEYCKYCGTRIERDTVESGQARPEESGEDVPTYETPRMIPLDMMERNEMVVFETHQGKVGVFSNHLLGAVLLLAGGIVVLVIPKWSIPGAILIVAALIVAFVGYLKWRSVIYALTTKRIIVLTGIFSKDLHESRLDRVQDIRMKISFDQRIFNYGDIYITTAGTSGVEAIWQNIPDPRKKQMLLRTLLAR